MQGMSERQYAAHVGLSRGAIQKAKESGRLVHHADGSINAPEEHMRRNGRIRPAKNCQKPFKAERYTTIGGAKDTTCRPYRNERCRNGARHESLTL